MFIDLMSYDFNCMFKKPKVVTLAPSSEHVEYPYNSPWVLPPPLQLSRIF